jgi:hypothetical protein
MNPASTKEPASSNMLAVMKAPPLIGFLPAA